MEAPFDPARPCVLFDLEMTAWEGSLASGWSRPGECREVIQIGAVRLGPGPALVEEGAFTCLVRPVRNPVLSDYIVALTGITQGAVEAHGLAFSDAQARFDAFIGNDERPVYCNGGDREILLENAGWNGLAPSRHAGRMFNIRRHLGALLNVGDTLFHSTDVAALAGSTAASGRGHDALGDARTIAAGLRLLIRDGRLA
ncbi:MAG: exonuclease domain-containing protein [Alphaproteobacteria bacterium]